MDLKLLIQLLTMLLPYVVNAGWPATPAPIRRIVCLNVSALGQEGQLWVMAHFPEFHELWEEILKASGEELRELFPEGDGVTRLDKFVDFPSTV